MSGIEAKASKAIISGKISISCLKSHWAVAWNVNKISSKIYDIQLLNFGFSLPSCIQLVQVCFSFYSLTLQISDKGI
jgi:hypothetical protein